LNFDRKIDIADFRIFKTEFPGGAGAFEAAFAGVPEPSSVVLLLLAAAWLQVGAGRPDMRRSGCA
jgi:hypothetical protein